MAHNVYPSKGSESMISSKDNAQIKAAKRLHQRKGRLEDKAMLIEGARLVADAWRAGVEPFIVFVQGETLTPSSPAHALLQEMEAAGVTIEETSKAVFAELSDTVTPQGIAAVLPIPELAWPDQPQLLLALDGVRDPGNAGTLLRSAEAVGVQGVIFGPETVDPFNSKVVRAAMGTHFRLPVREVESWTEAAPLAPMERWLLAAGEADLAYDAVDWRAPAVLVIGSEATGASAEIHARAHAIAIPMVGNVESLNAAMAGTVILFEIARQRRNA
jgi:TrmH family RNA methyltransferase